MIEVVLPADVDEVEREVWTTRRNDVATAADYDRIIEGPARILWPDETTAAYVGRFDDVDRLAAILSSIKHHGTGVRSNGMRTRSIPFGGRPRVILKSLEHCGRFAFDRDYPEAYDALAVLGRRVSDVYAEERPDFYERQWAWLDESIRPEYRLAGPYTSGILNFDNPLAYHRDNGNVSSSWNAQVVVRSETDGGLLVVPAWRVAFRAEHGSLVLLDAQRTTHGVTPIVKRRRSGYRISVVYYSLRALAVCGSTEEEIVRARQKRTEREDRRAETPA